MVCRPYQERNASKMIGIWVQLPSSQSLLPLHLPRLLDFEIGLAKATFTEHMCDDIWTTTSHQRYEQCYTRDLKGS